MAAEKEVSALIHQKTIQLRAWKTTDRQQKNEYAEQIDDLNNKNALLKNQNSILQANNSNLNEENNLKTNQMERLSIEKEN